MAVEPLRIADRKFSSRLILGTGKFSSPEMMRDALLWAGLMGLLPWVLADVCIQLHDRRPASATKVHFAQDIGPPPSGDPHVYERPPG